jgi:hypothetical protein
MVLQLRLYLSIMLICTGLYGFAQKSVLPGFSLMPGITANPFYTTKNYSTVTSYSLQIGAYNLPLYGLVRFGFPDYVMSAQKRDNYNISGSYFEPGLILYSEPLTEVNASFYIGVLGYFARYDHLFTFEIENAWGAQTFSYTGETKVKGILFEVGGLFTFYEGLKGTISVDLGGVRRPENPIPQVKGFTNASNIPGIGHGVDKFLFGINLGVHYLIY